MKRHVLILLLSFTGILHGAQPSPELIPRLDAQEVMRSIERAYRTAPIAERVTISVRTSAVAAEGPPRPPRTSQSTVIVRAARAHDGAADALRLEMPALALWIGNGRIVGVAQPDTKSVFLRDIGAATITGALEWSLPSLPLPQIALVFSNENSWSTLTPFCPGVEWDGAVQAANEGAIQLIGRSKAAQVRMTVDRSTYRLQAFEIIESARGDMAQIALKCAAIDPGEVRSWEIPSTGDRLVASLSQLVSQPPESAPADPISGLLLQDETLLPFSLAQDFQPPADVTERPPSAIVLVAFGLETGEPMPPAVITAVRAVYEMQRRRVFAAAEAADRPRRTLFPAWRPLAVFDVKQFARSELLRIAGDFRIAAAPGPDAAPGARRAEPLAWTLGGQDLLHSLTSGRKCAVIIVGPDLHAARTIPLRDDADPVGLAREIDDALKQLE